MAIEIGYWNLRGLVGFIKLISEYTGETIDWTWYDINSEREKWAKDKTDILPQKGFYFPNLPWMIDGNIKLTQSLAILKHIARKHHLVGKDISVLEMMEQQIIDVRTNWIKFLYQGSESDDEFLANFQPQLESINRVLCGRQWFGDELSYVDFLAWEFFDHIALIFPNIIQSNLQILRFYKKFANLPKIYGYIESDDFQNASLYGPKARYGGSMAIIKRSEKLY